MSSEDSVSAFIKAACVPLDCGHASGTLDQAQAILATNPEVALADIHTAAILGDDGAVRRFLTSDPASATAKRGPYEWDCAHAPLLLAISPARSQPVRRLRASGRGAAGRRRQPEHRLV